MSTPSTAVPIQTLTPSGAVAPLPVAPVPVQVPVPVTIDQQPQALVPVVDIAPPKKVPLLIQYWRKAGGGSFTLSLIIHAAILAIAYLVVETIVHEEKIDFNPGGGSKSGTEATQQLSKQVQAKRRSTLTKSTPMQRVVSLNANAAIALPDTPMDSISIPEMSSAMGGGSMGGGFGKSGSGGGFGNGIGTGGMSGVTFKPIMMFGKSIQARTIGVVMDVSGSMTPHLAKVIKELDRVAKGSPVVLYVGCGVKSIPKGKRIDDKAFDIIKSLKSKDVNENFEIFWRRSHGQKDYTPPKDPKDATEVPEKAVYEILANRPATYFIKSQGIEYAWTALVCDEFRKTEAVYWFADFQDAVDGEQIERVGDTLRRRKQKLYMHASRTENSFARVRDELVLPSGGEVITEEKKK